MRILDNVSSQMTTLHKVLLDDLFTLSTSEYTEVRIHGNNIWLYNIKYSSIEGRIVYKHSLCDANMSTSEYIEVRIHGNNIWLYNIKYSSIEGRIVYKHSLCDAHVPTKINNSCYTLFCFASWSVLHGPSDSKNVKKMI
jgi:hypothetical protein